LTPDLADQLARTAARGPGSRIRFHNLARQFAEHLIDIGVAQPVPLTEAQIARAALLADYEAYLAKQRGLSPRTIYHVLRFDWFLDHRFGTAMIDLTRLRAADAVGFVQHLLTGKHPYRDKTAVPSRPGEFHPEPLTDPDRILSHHPARAIARRLPPSTERRAPPGLTQLAQAQRQ
jgi:integrase/recombinase XerD